MNWVKRGLWVAAWTAWMWCGLGLFHELPRRRGPAIGHVPFPQSGFEAAFVGDFGLMAVLPRYCSENSTVRIYDFRSGALERELSLSGPTWLMPPAAFRTHGALLTFGASHKGKREPGFHWLDLETGKGAILSDKHVAPECSHPKNPWLVYRESRASHEKPKPLIVLDWKSGAELLVRKSDAELVPVDLAFFLGDTDRLVVPVSESPDYELDKPTAFEIWTIGKPSALEKVVRLPRFGSFVQATSSGRIAVFTRDAKNCHAEVYDLERERLLFSTPPVPPDERGEYYSNMRLSNDGRAILDGDPPKLWSVDEGRLLRLFESRQNAYVYETLGAAGSVEPWTRQWAVRSLDGWRTVALCDLGTGELQFRCWESESNMVATNRTGTMAMNRFGAVFELPFRVNYSLLALCQTILATPLVLLWAVLRWRGKRRLRLASIAP